MGAITMNVRLISVTPDAEKTIMYCARVSNPANQDSQNTKLLDYCIKHGHWSVFEMANMVVEIETSRAIAQQILRHRSFSFQEFSQRYAEAQGFETYNARSQDLKNRQNSVDNMSNEDKEWFLEAQNQVQENCERLYNLALRKNIAKEQARFLLPLSTTTKLYMNGTIRSWLHFLDLRCGNGTQLEHKQIADKIKEIFIEQFPNTARAKNWLEVKQE
jgi:thymidylate synthase (FAD)